MVICFGYASLADTAMLGSGGFEETTGFALVARMEHGKVVRVE